MQAGVDPSSDGGAKSQVLQCGHQAIVIDVIEEAFHIEQEDGTFETMLVGIMDVVEESQAGIQARRMLLPPKLVTGEEGVCGEVILDTLCDHLLQEFAETFQEENGAMGLWECVVRSVWFGEYNDDCFLTCMWVVAKGEACVVEVGECYILTYMYLMCQSYLP